jgi:hypothetical protein
MTYAVVEDIAASWERYRGFAANLEGAVPDGLILHAAGPTDEGFRIIELWESEEACRRFGAQRGNSAADASPHSLPVIRELRLAHVIYGSRRD